jgi:hypothetical protein
MSDEQKQKLIEDIKAIQWLTINATHTLYEKSHDAKVMREVSGIYFDMQRANEKIDSLLYEIRQKL